MKSQLLKFAAVALAGVCSTMIQARAATVVASDDYQSYGSLGYGSNGGTGLGALSYLEGSNGGVFLETGGAAIDGGKSMGIYSSDGGQAADRTITGSPNGNGAPNVIGSYDVSARFNLGNDTGFSGFNIKSGVGSHFADSELIRFGLDPSQGSNKVAVYFGGG